MESPLKLETLGQVTNISADKEKDYIKFDIYTTDRKATSLVAEYGPFRNWMANKIKKKEVGDESLVFENFIKEFLTISEAVEGGLHEIVDDEGNIMPSIDKPSNADNSGIGSSKFDLDTVYKQAIPRNLRFYSGSYGTGFITW